MSSSALVDSCSLQTPPLLLSILIFFNSKSLICPPGVIVTHYLQSITPALALGGELVYHRRPGEEGSVMSLVGRYTGRHITRPDVDHSHLFICSLLTIDASGLTGSNYIATLTLGSAGAHASYYHKANEQVRDSTFS